jgi:hypothetical protein
VRHTSLHGGASLANAPTTQIEKTAASDLPPGGILPPAPILCHRVLLRREATDVLSWIGGLFLVAHSAPSHLMAHILFIRLLPDPGCAVYVGGFTKSVRACTSGSISPIPGPGQLIYLSYSGISYTLCNIPPPASCLLVLPIPSHAIILEDVAIRCARR